MQRGISFVCLYRIQGFVICMGDLGYGLLKSVI